ncbi:MAG: hypothetical protein JSR66_30215 [Proteobacteria bacterium]|nr:hypothetical protein [Pseudomonadota bacterium]
MFDPIRRRFSTLAMVCAFLGLITTAQTRAACLNSTTNGIPTAAAGQFSPALYRPGDYPGSSLIRVGDDDEDDSIVGLWKFKLSGFLKDFGTQAFHAGGTETMFSAGVDPSTGDVCQGVWRKIGRSTYTLNHIAMAWTAPGAQYGVLIHIHMTIRLAHSGDAFTGHYSVSLFSATPENPFDESGGAFASGGGDVTASRVRPD